MKDVFRSLRQNPRIIPIYVMVSLVMAGNGLVGPILPLYAQTFGISATLVGFVLAAFGIARFCANIPTGILSLYVQGRNLLFFGSFLLGIGAVGAALTDDFVGLFLWRAVQGFGSGMYMTMSGIALAKLAPREERARMVSIYTAAMLFGVSIGPALGGLLAGLYGYTAPFWAYAVAAFGAFLTGFIIPRRPKTAAEPAAARVRLSFRNLSGHVFATACFVVFCMAVTRGASQWLLIPLIAYHQYGLDAATIGIALTLLAASNLVVLPWAATIIAALGLQGLTIASLLTMFVSLLAIAYGGTTAWFWAGVTLLGVGSGLNTPAISTYLIEIVPPDLLGPSTAFQRSSNDAGLILGPILVGLLHDEAGVSNAGGLVVNAGMLLVCAALFLFSTLLRPNTPRDM